MSNKVHTDQPLPLQSAGGGAAGLEYLAQIDNIIIQQQVELAEVLVGFDANNKYVISNSAGQQAFTAAENSDCCIRQCCGGGRPFSIHIYDNFQTELLHISRPYRCGCNWGPGSCFHELTVTSSSTGEVLGMVRQSCSFWKPALTVLDAAGIEIMKINGRCCPCGCDDVPFRITAMDGTEIGAITKKFRGCLIECLTRADLFHLNFPMDLHVNAKATLLGAVFLIDFMYFESNN